MKKSILFLLLSVVCKFSVTYAQSIVSLNPPFPQDTNQVILTFNADQGNAALANLPLGTNVYAHTGITVDGENWQYVVGNWATADSRVAMNRIGSTNQ